MQLYSCQHIEHRVYHSYMVMIFIVQSINMTSQGKKFTIGQKVSCTCTTIIHRFTFYSANNIAIATYLYFANVTHGIDVDSITSVLKWICIH